MPLFDIRGARRALPVATTQPDDASFAAAARAVVSEHLSTLLGEQVVTVAEKPRSTADLLALDSTGRPVVVQIMPRLTAEGLLEALDVAGRASRLTRRDLAAKHPGGPDRFYATLRDFFDAVPVTRHERPTSGAVRLVIVCADVDAALLPTVDFLRSGAGHVEVLHVGLVAGSGGQRLIDISPRETRTASAVSAARLAVEHALTGAVPVVPPEAEVPGQLRSAFGSVTPPVGASPPPVVNPSASPVAAAQPAPPTLVPAQPDASPTGPDESVAYVPVFLDLPQGLPALPGRPSDLPVPGADQDVSPVLDLLAPPRDSSSVVGPIDADLAELARALDEPLPLVWLRHRRGERFEVVLHPDGSLHTEEGVRYADPTWAASAVSGGASSDGWRVWRDGDHGRTLAELRA